MNNVNGDNRINTLFIYLLFPVMLFLTFNMHSRVRPFNYHGVIYSDAAGYYVYLPMWFIYGNTATGWPNQVDSLTGNGFHIDEISNTIKTKYFSGPAILQSPFFLVIHSIQKLTGKSANGFTVPYIYSVILASVIYVWLGLLLLYKYLITRFNSSVSLVSVLLTFVATNVFYYAVTSNGMSHAYSFFLFCLFIYIINRKMNSGFKVFVSGVIISLIFLCRPVNIIFIPIVLFLNTDSFIDIKAKIVNMIPLFKKIHLFFIGIVLFLLPQISYHAKSFKDVFLDTYQGESFSNWLSPELLKVWFSTNNGLFTYTPFMAIALIGIFSNFRIKKAESLYIGLLVFALSLICASWWNWWFGCSYGARSFTEYYSLLSIPVAQLISVKRVYVQKLLLWLCIAVCIAVNLNIIYYYDGCFYGGEWDWEAYWKLHR